VFEEKHFCAILYDIVSDANPRGGRI